MRAARIDDISPTDDNFSPSLSRVDQSVSGKALCIALSTDGRRAYLGGHSGVWRSDDGGETWTHPEWRPANPGGPTPPGALLPTNVYDLVIHPTNNDVVFAGTGRDARQPSQAGIYRSTDGGRSWARVHQFRRSTPGGVEVGTVGRLAAVPDSPRTLYAAGEFALAWTTDGGATWTESLPQSSVFHVVAGPTRPGGRRVYVVGRSFWYSLDGGGTWHTDPRGPTLGAVTDGAGASSRALAIHPQSDNVVYIMRGDLTLWLGEFPEPPSTSPGTWTQLPPPPVAGGTDSGATFVIPHLTREGGILLYVSDRRSVHGIGREPSSTEEWTLVEDGHCHVDPHGLALTPDFRHWGPDGEGGGRAVLINDGGVNVTTDGMRTWRNARGLSTLNVANVAVNSVPGGPTAVTFGGGDNFGFSSSDGGATWRTQAYLGGDNDCSFSDPRQPTRMILFAPRHRPSSAERGEILLFASSDANPPDTSLGSPHQRIPGIPAPPVARDRNGAVTWGWNAVSYYVNYGYRPLVLTLLAQVPRPDGDLVVIRFTGVVGVDPGHLVRTTALSQITAKDDWVTEATAEGPGVKSFRVGPPLPDPLVSVVQASGGHEAATFYVGNAAPITGVTGDLRLWKLAVGATAWQQIVPPVPAATGPAPTIARRFFVDPYRPNLLYVLGADHVYRSHDGGRSWVVDASLERAVTEDGAYPFVVGDTGNPAETVLRDMQFDPQRPGFRLAAGVAGVFGTRDGQRWLPLLRSSAVAMQPTGIAYDWVACDRALYVGTSNRGLLRLSPLPPDWEFPRGSLQAAQGRITLLRVHDLGTGYGPRHDFLDAEIVVWLDSQPEKAFGLRLRNDADQPSAEGMLAVLRGCFNRDRPVRLEFVRTGCRTAEIVRVIERI